MVPGKIYSRLATAVIFFFLTSTITGSYHFHINFFHSGSNVKSGLNEHVEDSSPDDCDVCVLVNSKILHTEKNVFKNSVSVTSLFEQQLSIAFFNISSLYQIRGPPTA